MRIDKSHYSIMSKIFKLNELLLPCLIVSLAGLIIDGINVYLQFNDLNILLLNSTVSLLILSTYLLSDAKIIHKRYIIPVIVYSIIISTFISVPIRLDYSDKHLVMFFIRTEMIFFTLSLFISTLFGKKHSIYLSVINGAYIVYSYFITGGILSYTEYLFYFAIFCGSNWIVYIGNRNIYKLASRLQRSNITITRKNKELREFNDYKDNIVKVIGHDIRQPLTQVYALLEIYDESRDDKILPLLKNTSEYTISLFDDVLAWIYSQSFEKNNNITLEKIELRPLVKKVSNAFSIPLKTKNIKIENNINESMHLNSDIYLLETVVRNLINNAIKFSFANSKITIDGTYKENQHIISVKDQGVGMTDEQMKNLFEVSKKKSIEGTFGEKGSGLGLVICENLVKRQKGKIKIESQEGVGTTVSIHLPTLI